MATVILSILLIAAGVYLTYVLIQRLSRNTSSDEPFDPGSTSNEITESGQILPPPLRDKDD